MSDSWLWVLLLFVCLCIVSFISVLLDCFGLFSRIFLYGEWLGVSVTVLVCAGLSCIGKSGWTDD